MFDWVEFNPERLTQHAPLSALIMAIPGFLVALFAGVHVSAINTGRVCKRKSDLTEHDLLFLSFGFSVVTNGRLVAVHSLLLCVN